MDDKRRLVCERRLNAETGPKMDTIKDELVTHNLNKMTRSCRMQASRMTRIHLFNLYTIYPILISIILLHLISFAQCGHPHRTPHHLYLMHLSEKEPVPCEDVLRGSGKSLPCICSKNSDNGTIVNCDQVPFFGDFPILPNSYSIHTFIQRHAGVQNLASQLFVGTNVPLKHVDFSFNLLRRLMDRVFAGIENTLEELYLSHNLLGDQLNPIFSTNEFMELKLLKTLDLSYNKLRAIDSNLFKGLKKLMHLNLEGNELNMVPSASITSLISLKELVLSGNEFTEIADNSFPMSLSGLHSLNMSNNRIMVIRKSALTGLTDLKELYLAKNKLRDLSSNVFLDLKNLEVLDLTDNYFDYVPFEAISHLKRLKKLLLGSNNIHTIEENSFSSIELPHLEHLDLSRNTLTNLVDPNIFMGLPQLRYLNLAYNQLKKIEENDYSLFDGLTKLEVLDLSDNRLYNFPSQALSQLKNLKKLFLDFNLITTISEDIVSSVPSIDELSLRFNLIREVPDALFKKNQNIRLFNINGNDIEYISQDTFKLINDYMLGLDIGFNDLMEIPKLNLPKVMILNLAMNQFINVGESMDIFDGLPSLRHFNLSFNQINYLPPGIFDSNKLIEVMDLEGNQLDRLERGVFSNSTFNRINLKNNRIKELPHLAFEDLIMLLELDLSFNELSSIKNGAFDDLHFLKKLNLENNKLTSFKGDFFTSRTRIEEINLSNNLISYLYPNSFIIHKKLKSINLGHNKLSYFPSEILNSIRSLETINLSFNRLQSLDNSDFSNMPRLKNLHLQGNHINFVSGNSFNNSTLLQYLDLSMNQISNLEDVTLKGISRLNLDLSYNNITCLPPDLFNRLYLFQLESINLANNQIFNFNCLPLKKQYLFLEKLNLSNNQIDSLPLNSDVLVNIKDFDISFNPLKMESHAVLFGEPKSFRKLKASGTNIDLLDTQIEAPFLRHLNLSHNLLKSVNSSSFTRTTLLKVLDISHNLITKLKRSNKQAISPFRSLNSSLKELYLSANPIENLVKGDLDPNVNLEVLELSNLANLTHFECDLLSKINQLKVLHLIGYPSLNYLEIQECLTHLNTKLEKLSVEMKEAYLQGHLQRAYSMRMKELTISGNKLQTLSTGSLSGIRSSNLKFKLIDTKIKTIPPSMFNMVPMSTKIDFVLVNDNEITNIKSDILKALDSKQMGVKIKGLELNKLVCDCNLEPLLHWILEKAQQFSNAKYYSCIDSVYSLTCHWPEHLRGQRLVDLDYGQLICGNATTTKIIMATTPSQKSSTRKRVTTPYKLINSPDIIFEMAPTKRPYNHRNVYNRPSDRRTKTSSLTKVDTMIIGTVSGVIIFLCILILIVCIIRLKTPTSPAKRINHYRNPYLRQPVCSSASSCTCMKSIQCTENYSQRAPSLSYYGGTLRPVPLKVVPVMNNQNGNTISRVHTTMSNKSTQPSAYYMSYPVHNENDKSDVKR